MCTVTIVRIGDMVRVACNRDELRHRPPACAPFIARAGRGLALMPQDPQGGGTWIAATSAGLVFALLNVHGLPASSPARPSRGLLIPDLLDCETLDEVALRVARIPPAAFAPCRLLAAGEHEVFEATLAGGVPAALLHRIRQPLMFTSSSLGDGLVEPPRRRLFEQMLGASAAVEIANRAARQDAFHGHRWRDRPDISVHMSRPEACTVSTTVVEVTRSAMRMKYQPARCDAGTPVGILIDRHQVHHAAAGWARREHAAV